MSFSFECECECEADEGKVDVDVDVDGPEVEAELEVGFEEEEEEEEAPFLDWRAEEKIPSGTTRAESQGMESIVFRLPSVDLVKYASGWMREELR